MKPVACARGSGGGRRGTVLIVTIVLVFALAGMTLVLCRSMRVEMIASANYTASLQASTIERGAEQFLLAVLTEVGGDLSSLTEDYFAAVPVGDGYFWVLRPDYGDTALPAFGLVDESSKLNINVAGFDQLMRLPCMTDDVAGAMVDWRDEDDTLTPGGAESEYYLSQDNAYYCKNAAFETVEEVLLVRGATWPLLYGNGQAPPLGTTSLFSISGSSMLSDVWLQRGIYDLLTVYSSEPNTAPDGSRRVNVNDRQRRDQVREMLRNQLGSSRGDQVFSSLGNEPVRDIFDLYFRARMTPDELSQIADYVTTSSSRVRGRINVNTASRDVLLTLEDLQPSDVDKLISQRHGVGSTQSQSIGWVAEALGQKAIGLGSYITGRGYQYAACILAVSGNGRSFKQIRVVIDMSRTTPQIIYRRDLTDRGWPMDPQILASLRAGQSLAGWSGVSGSLLGGTVP